MTQPPPLTPAAAAAAAAAADDVIGVVLCAGLGTRLRPATLTCPKPALPFLGRPLATYGVSALARAGITRVGANLHHLPDVMEAALRAHTPAGTSLTCLREPEILGTGGGLRALWDAIDPAASVVLYHGDVLCGLALAPLLAAHRASGALATLALRLRDPDDALRNVFIDETSQVAGLYDRFRLPQAAGRLRELAFTGVHVLSPALRARLPAAGACCIVTEVYTALLSEGQPLGAYITGVFHEDLGTPARLLGAQARVLRAPALLPDAPTAGIDPRAHIEAGAHIDPLTRIDGPVIVRAGAVIGPNVALCGALEVRPSARLSDVAWSGQGVIEGAHAGVVQHSGGALEDMESPPSADRERTRGI
jgi:mannose-1-phosphate guanylyltransferase